MLLKKKNANITLLLKPLEKGQQHAQWVRIFAVQTWEPDLNPTHSRKELTLTPVSCCDLCTHIVALVCPSSYTQDTPKHSHTIAEVIFRNYENILLIPIKGKPSERGKHNDHGLSACPLLIITFSHSAPPPVVLTQGSCCFLHVWLTPTHHEMLTPDLSQKPLLPG